MYELSWLIPQRVILLHVSGELTDTMIDECDAAIIKMVETGDPSAALIHQVLTVGEITSRPGVKVLSRMKSLKHPRMGWVIGVGVTNPFIKTVGTIVAQIVRIRAKAVDTIEDALVFLHTVDSTLPDGADRVQR